MANFVYNAYMRRWRFLHAYYQHRWDAYDRGPYG